MLVCSVDIYLVRPNTATLCRASAPITNAFADDIILAKPTHCLSTSKKDGCAYASTTLHRRIHIFDGWSAVL